MAALLAKTPQEDEDPGPSANSSKRGDGMMEHTGSGIPKGMGRYRASERSAGYLAGLQWYEDQRT